MWEGHLEGQKNPDRLKRIIHVDRIGVQSTFVYIYAVLRVLVIWANCFFLSTCLFFLKSRRCDDNQQITVSHFGEHKRLHLESSKQNYYIVSLRAMIKAIFTIRMYPRVKWRGHTAFARHNKACVFLHLNYLAEKLQIPTQILWNSDYRRNYNFQHKYCGTQIIARDSHSNRLTSEDKEHNLSVYSVSTSNFKPSPLHPW